MGEAGADVRARIHAGVRGSVPPRRGAVYVDDPIWEWTSYQGPPRTSVPHYDLTAYERRRALAHGAIACSREEIVAVVRRMRSSCAARGAETGP